MQVLGWGNSPESSRGVKLESWGIPNGGAAVPSSVVGTGGETVCKGKEVIFINSRYLTELSKTEALEKIHKRTS
jgi:hypothetical protein